MAEISLKWLLGFPILVTHFPVSKLTRLLSQKNVFVDVIMAAILVSPVQCFKAYTEDKKYYATNEGLVRVPMFIPVSAKQVLSSFCLILN